MYFMSDFCRVCLQGEKGLKDIMKDKETPDSLYSKLKLCVSEVDWCMYKTMFICEKCVIKLNTAFEFKCQCIKSTEILRNFLNQLGIEESKTDVKRHEVNSTIVEENLKASKDKSDLNPASFVHVRPDQQLFTPGHLQNVIVSPSATQSVFPNLFFNLIPTNLLKASSPPPLSSVSRLPLSKTAPQAKDANQNMFVSIHRFFPVISPTKDSTIIQSSTNHSVMPSISTNNVQPEITRPVVKSKEVSQILTENNSEELSIEIDPACFDLEDEESPDSINKSEMNILRDWEDVIVSNKISSEHDNINIRTSLNNSLPTLNKMLEVNNSPAPLDIGSIHKRSNTHNPHSASISIVPKQQVCVLSYFENKIILYNF
ncbi:uncharacterized protein LOC112905534 [Agrilus planipennis]|uniref:Uncharacterized protein LOC112905534 n=1 Tax=Agrilus planipennis TaxID=224129 RepID=A0A7F5RDC1_AGRPL|nr:uncharacterized protein LOC112905534 [Agrilus planipennis]